MARRIENITVKLDDLTSLNHIPWRIMSDKAIEQTRREAVAAGDHALAKKAQIALSQRKTNRSA